MSRLPTPPAALASLLVLLALAPPASPSHDGSSPPPEVAIEWPREEETVEGLVEVEGTASAHDSVFEVQVQIDDRGWQTAAGRDNWTFPWNTSWETEGEHTVAARSFDGIRYSAPDQVNVTVVDAAGRPSITIDEPAPGAQVNGTIEIRGNASSPEGSVDRVDVRVGDGPWRRAEGTDEWSHRWETADLPPGAYEVTARAVDEEGRSRNATRIPHVRSPGAGDTSGANLSLALASPEDGAPGPRLQLSGEVGGVAEDGPPIQVVHRFAGGPADLLEAGADGSFDRSLDASGLPTGSHDLAVRAIQGDAASETRERTVEVPRGAAAADLAPGGGASVHLAALVVAAVAGLGLVAWSRR